jgi:hypothetical protein
MKIVFQATFTQTERADQSRSSAKKADQILAENFGSLGLRPRYSESLGESLARSTSLAIPLDNGQTPKWQKNNPKICHRSIYGLRPRSSLCSLQKPKGLEPFPSSILLANYCFSLPIPLINSLPSRRSLQCLSHSSTPCELVLLLWSKRAEMTAQTTKYVPRGVRG